MRISNCRWAAPLVQLFLKNVRITKKNRSEILSVGERKGVAVFELLTRGQVTTRRLRSVTEATHIRARNQTCWGEEASKGEVFVYRP
jgi:hypothetical protein